MMEPLFTAWGAPVTALEVLGFALALSMVWATLRVKTVAWPLAMASSAAYCVLFQQSGLYGEAGLQLFFIAIAAWGWWQWLHGKAEDGHALRVRALPRRSAWRAAAATLAGWPALALLLDHSTDSTVPWLDALPTVASVTGQWLLARQYVANWPVWLGVNLVSVALFASKGLWLTVLLYALFAVLSVLGWIAWRQRALKASTQAA